MKARLIRAIQAMAEAGVLLVLCTLPFLGVSLAWDGHVYAGAACWGATLAAAIWGGSRRRPPGEDLEQAVRVIAEALQRARGA